MQNGLTYLWTLTFAPEHLPEGREGAHLAGRNFIRRLRRRLDRDLPYVFVVEWGKSTGRVHLHLALGMYVDHSLLRDVWGLGHVFVSKKKAPMRVQGGKRNAARAAAHYLSKYIGKGLEEAPDGRQAYWLAEGFDVRVEFGGGVTWREAWAVAQQMVGGPVQRWWSSGDEEDWQGPPVMWVQYGDP